MVVNHRDRANSHLGTDLGNRGKDRSALGAIGESVGRVFYVAAGKHLSLRRKHGRAHLELGIRSVRILHRGLGGSQQRLT